MKSRALIGVFAGHYFPVTPVCSITDRQIEHINHEVFFRIAGAGEGDWYEHFEI